jgi:hypothetical protein
MQIQRRDLGYVIAYAIRQMRLPPVLTLALGIDAITLVTAGEQALAPARFSPQTPWHPAK